MNPQKTLIYLSSCAINRVCPDAAVVSAADMDALYAIASNHQLTALVASALQSAGVVDSRFKQEWAKTVRKNLIFDTERASVLSALEAAGIWYMPLKGAVLKDYYPQIGMRQMSDNDILVDAFRADDVRKIMISLGYTTTKYDEGHQDDYQKPPISHFEMHRRLFTEKRGELFRYYRDVKNRLVKDEGNRYGFHFTDEDFYIYMIAHEYKHYSLAGVGIRSLIDAYVFLQKFSGKLNWDYIKAECEKLQIAEFEEKNRELALAAFSAGTIDNLSAEQKEMLRYFLASGSYGTKTQSVRREIEKSGKLKYVMNRIFLPMDVIKKHFPVFYKYKILLPILPFYRLMRNRKSVNVEMQTIRTFSEATGNGAKGVSRTASQKATTEIHRGGNTSPLQRDKERYGN